MLRPCDVDTSEEIWMYKPAVHKTEHHNRARVVLIGPKGQAVLRLYLQRDTEVNCFSPWESEQERRRVMKADRVTPLSCGNRQGTNCKTRPKREAGIQYTRDSYRRAIHRACDKAFPPSSPLAQHVGETAQQWRDRLTDTQRDKLKLWQSQHRWSPNRLRHTAGTEIRKSFGLEAVQVTLGHASANTSQIYAERDLSLAARVMKEVG